MRRFSFTPVFVALVSYTCLLWIVKIGTPYDRVGAFFVLLVGVYFEWREMRRHEKDLQFAIDMMEKRKDATTASEQTENEARRN